MVLDGSLSFVSKFTVLEIKYGFVYRFCGGCMMMPFRLSPAVLILSSATNGIDGTLVQRLFRQELEEQGID
jgi:hypothetical protein